jgi:L-lactate utilization protein LutC
MTSARAEVLERVRAAVRAGNRAGTVPPLASRGGAGYQGAGTDPVASFATRLEAAGGRLHLVTGSEAAATTVLELLRTYAPRRTLLGRGPYLDSLGLVERLTRVDTVVFQVESSKEETWRNSFFAADLGISGVDYLVAETGSVVLLAQPHEPRSLSLLPPVHIAVAHRRQLVPDLFDLFELELPRDHPNLPSCACLITGPSKTGDIELRLVTGVHGPGQVHVVLETG